MNLSRRLASEALGTCALVATVVGSGIMADALTSDDAVALLGNTLATGAMLVVLITALGPLSGAHFNPAVSMTFFLRGELTWGLLGLYVPVQSFGGVSGTLLAHAMFDLPLWQEGVKIRSSGGQWLAEVVATFGLIGVILSGLKHRSESVPVLVGLYISGAYWFTASTSFANPAVTLARAFTESFAGIRFEDVAPFVSAQVLGALVGLLSFSWLLREKKHDSDSS